MTKKKVVISGATSATMNVVIDLIKQSDEYSIIGITTNLKKIQRNDIEWVELDLQIAENDYDFLKNCDTIIHTAAISNAYTKQDYLDINLQSTKTLIDNSNLFGIRKFVYISSILACKNCGDYGISKLKSENYIKSNANNYLIIRPSQLYGYSDKAPIDNLIEKIKKNKFIICPIGDPSILIPLYYKDAARLIFNSIFTDKLSPTIKLIIGPQAFNYKSMALYIASCLSKKIIIVPIPKIVLIALMKTIKLFGVKRIIYPDQIFRLYNPNINVKPIMSNATQLSDHINEVK